MVHQETLEADLKALERQLCRRFGSCSALPPLPKQKERGAFVFLLRTIGECRLFLGEECGGGDGRSIIGKLVIEPS